MDIDASINKAPVIRPPMVVPVPRRKINKKRKTYKEPGDPQDHGKYNRVANLASAPWNELLAASPQIR